MKILTISVAAYNVEQYLRQTLESFVNDEVMDEIEVLVIDDGSTDGTGDIATEYQNRFPESYRYIKKENGGHGSTINKGIELASGKYFKICDGDDWFNTEGLVSMVKRLKEIDSDVIITNYNGIYSDGGVEEWKWEFLEEYKEYTFSKKFDYRMCGLASIAVKTDLLKKRQIHITEHCFYVDVEFTLYSILLARSFCYINIFLYIYRKNSLSQSVSKKNMLKNVEMQKKVSRKICNLYQNEFKNSDGNKREYAFLRIKRTIGALYRTFMLMETGEMTKENIRKFDKEIKKDFPDVYRKMWNDWFVFSVRVCGYLFVPLIRSIYRKKCKFE